MALASYFSKNLLALSQVLEGANSARFERILNNTIVGIAIGAGIKNKEAKVAADLTVRLLARLYPKINIIDLSGKETKLIAGLKNLARSINKYIEFSEGEPSVTVSIGAIQDEGKKTSGPTFHIGSDSWVARFSAKNPVTLGNGDIPFGAGIAACIGASNIFRAVFAEFISDNDFDESFSLSLVTLDDAKNQKNPEPGPLDIGKVTLVGFGAIANGFIWSLSHCSFLKGEIILIEPQDIENTNLQRYVLALEKHVGFPKIDIATEILLSKKIKLKAYPDDWAGYLDKTEEWKNEKVVIAVDNVADRIAIQASLPHQLINAYTENNLLGIGRHFDFVEGACLVCTYLSEGGGLSHSQQVAGNLRLGDKEPFVREYLFHNKPMDDQLLQLIASANQIEITELAKFKGIPMLEFYSRAVCGGILLSLRKENNMDVHIEAPLAFQSAMAGILELAEIVIREGNLRTGPFPTVTQFYPLLPVKSGVNPYNFDFPKDKRGKCICRDTDFQEAYLEKWKKKRSG